MDVFSILISAALLVASIQDESQTTDLQELAGHNLDFATGLYRKIASGSDDNVAVSPLSATLGLASLAEGARGDTRRQLLEALGLAPMERDGEPDRISTLLHQLWEVVAQVLATGLFTSQQAQADSGFSGQVKGSYGADVRAVDFTKAQAAKRDINEYVMGVTGRKITEVVNTVDPQSLLMLVTAAYFTGQWKFPFNVNFTQEDRFYVDKYHIVMAPMMIHSGKHYLAYDPELKVGILKLPCTDNTAMLVLLPDEEVDYTFIDEALTGEVFLRWVAKLKKTKLEIQLPRFSVEKSFSLKQSLNSLGVSTIFESSADLSGISDTPNLKVSEAVQKVLVAVDEKGGSDAQPFNNMFVDPLPPRLIFNRPFLFLIYHEDTKALLHMGRVVDPTRK
ncbi:serpin peptidase inhibitor, clade A (alpha-1 antiproteinase, antitrypsin), member 10a [Brachyhypopomus gauderio]|uniref:serpin peptidase inhibitor, clade A (alpha-1 antiproteinase, antitrypsin), member 10a n=1 Tax=Brachyhypopomus gauderio TaxID=698409 RepID=UPI00404287B1